MIKQLKNILVILLLTISSQAVAQSVAPIVKATISPDSVLIGDRFTLTIDVEKDQVQSIFFPAFKVGPQSEDNAAPGSLECLVDHPIDTVSHKGRDIHLRKRYTLTAFDEGVYNLGRPSVLYADKNIVDTLYGCNDSLLVYVSTFKIDSTSMLCDIKPLKKMPFRFGEISGYLSVAIVAIALIVVVILLLARYLAKRGKKLSDLFKPEPPLPPHIVAISALEELHHQKLWQNNKHKQYYSALSDILRTYLDGRFDIGAMEMTTDEIVEAVKGVELPQKSAMDLVAVLRDADLVKFAKAMPDSSENEEAYNKSYYFVEETKPVEQTEESGEEVKQ